jgi:hypothetical protein
MKRELWPERSAGQEFGPQLTDGDQTRGSLSPLTGKPKTASWKKLQGMYRPIGIVRMFYIPAARRPRQTKALMRRDFAALCFVVARKTRNKVPH